MVRGRSKRRSLKADGKSYGQNLCRGCLAFGCDPYAMSMEFRHKVGERRRQKLCPCCGEPTGFCKCKSSETAAPGTHAVQTHNNKKRNQAMAVIHAKEMAYLAWKQHEEALCKALGEDTYGDILYSLHNHNTPKYPWATFSRQILNVNIDATLFMAGWLG